MEMIKAKNRKKNNAVQSGLNSAVNSEHGGNIYKIARDLGIPEENLMDFSASINPLGVPESVKRVIQNELDSLVNYPDPDTTTLNEKLALLNGISHESIVCGNGSAELIYLIPRALKPETVLVPTPTFSEYKRACRLNEKLRIVNYELREENAFRIIPHDFGEAMRGCDMAFLCNPNNPTGGLLKKGDVLEIAEAAEREKCFLVVDEAFIDFKPEESVIGSVTDFPHLIVLRSMTKFYALAGLRIGYGVFHEKVISRVLEFKEPWTVNNLAQKAAVAAIDDRDYACRTIDLIRKEKEYMERKLGEMNIEFFPSVVNYYMLRMNDAHSKVLKLRKKGILVRDCSNFKGLDASYVRIAVKSHEHNSILLKEMAEL